MYLPLTVAINCPAIYLYGLNMVNIEQGVQGAGRAMGAFPSLTSHRFYRAISAPPPKNLKRGKIIFKKGKMGKKVTYFSTFGTFY